MKKISLGVMALLLTCATVFADGPVTKTPAKKVKQECTETKCVKDGKVVDCPDKASCPDKANCHEMACCSDKCCS